MEAESKRPSRSPAASRISKTESSAGGVTPGLMRPLLSRSAGRRPPQLEEKPTPTPNLPSASSGGRPSPYAPLSSLHGWPARQGRWTPGLDVWQQVVAEQQGACMDDAAAALRWVSGPPGRPSAPRGSQLPRADGPVPALFSFLSVASLCRAKTLTLAGSVPPAPLSGLSSPEVSRPRAALTLSKKVDVDVQSFVKACRQVGKTPTYPATHPSSTLGSEPTRLLLGSRPRSRKGGCGQVHILIPAPAPQALQPGVLALRVLTLHRSRRAVSVAGSPSCRVSVAAGLRPG